MSNDKRPSAPDSAPSPTTTDSPTTEEPVEPAQEVTSPVEPARARPKNGGGRSTTVGRKIKNYLN